VSRLRPIYHQALSHPQVVALAVGTRPDCVPNDVLELLSEVGAEKPLTVEYGMQTMHDRSLDWMNRGHHHSAFVDAVLRSHGRGFEVCAHVILGIPGETRDDMLATAREIGRLPVDAVKIHNLYAVKRTPLAAQVESGQVRLLERDEYLHTLVDFLERLPTRVVVERVSGDAPPDYLVGPEWCRDRIGVRRALELELARRDTWQGKLS
jgi:radical SAM protein (TIGR01212 family)